MRNIDSIIIHCAATPPDMDIGVEEIRHWHVEERGWDDIGYHFVITRDGDVDKGRALDIQGAHAYGYNETSIGVCLAGGVDEHGDADCNFTRSQWQALDELVDDLQQEFGALEVIGHRDVSDKDCPSFDVLSWVER